MISIGSTAPAWKATAYQNGEFVTLSSDDYKGKWVLIYWWPFDFSGICNSELLGFQQLEADFAAIGVELLVQVVTPIRASEVVRRYRCFSKWRARSRCDC